MRKWLPLMMVCLGAFMLLIDVTVVNVALPDMVGDLGASFGALQWVIDGYALALAALVLGAGSIADLVADVRARAQPGRADHRAYGAGHRGGGHVRDHVRAAQQRLRRSRPR
jgi:MFS family permease